MPEEDQEDRHRKSGKQNGGTDQSLPLLRPALSCQRGKARLPSFLQALQLPFVARLGTAGLQVTPGAGLPAISGHDRER